MAVFLRPISRRPGALVPIALTVSFGLLLTQAVYRAFPMESSSDALVVFGIGLGVMAVGWSFRFRDRSGEGADKSDVS